MDIKEITNAKRVDRQPDKVEVIFSSKDFKEQGVGVKKIELRLYIENFDEKLGPFSLITAFVDTDIGSIEMIYDEGYRGNDPLTSTIEFLVNNLGLSGLILRSIISLKNFQKN